MSLPTTCTSLIFPRECYCQRTRYTPIFSSNETYLRCRQLTKITRKYSWSNVTYDRLVFETLNDNLTLDRLVFADIIVGTIRFNTYNLFLNNRSFENARIDQLILSHHNLPGRINFQSNSQIFYGSMITNLNFKSIDFQRKISEEIFFNTKIKFFTILSSKFYGFTGSTNRTSFYVNTFTIISSINTTNLTGIFFPRNLVYQQLEKIQLTFNEIHSLDAHVFHDFNDFQGQLLLSNNQIQYLHSYALANLVSLKNLSLAYNLLENLSSKHFQDLKQLNTLDLSSNLITKLNNDTFKYLENLQILHLNFNPIELIESDAFANLTNLQEISFHGVHLLDHESIQWIWNLASLHVIHSIETDFDLSDVAFCILSRYNQSISYLSRQDACSCPIHYFNRNYDFDENTSLSIFNYKTNYLRLTPICSESNVKQKQNTSENEFILRNLQEHCHYKLLHLDCDAMTVIELENTTIIPITTEIFISTSRTTPIDHTTIKSLNNTKKLFTVLAILAAITIGAIILVFFWYRFKAMLKRRRKKRKFLQHQRHFNTPVTPSPLSSLPRYASVDILGNTDSVHLLNSNRKQFEAFIESPSSTISNIGEPMDKTQPETYMDDEQTPTLC
ncbi:hypothetical protein I4U23_025257 [Adineta vaga]|nr:hypothetical protein I4U23_025257 [Adineta vaga]